MTEKFRSHRLLFFLTMPLCFQVPPVAGQTISDVLTRTDLPTSCVPNLEDKSSQYYVGCCGAPGRRGCLIGGPLDLINTCTIPPGGNKIRTDSYRPTGQNVLCDLPKASCDSGLGTLNQN